MKKLIGAVAIAAVLATSAFAELSISGGATQLWSPIAYNGGDVMTGSRSPWGGGRTASIGFTWVSEDEKAGSAFSFVYNPWYDGDDTENKKFGIQPDGNRNIWVKPWDFLKVLVGHWDNYGGTDISAINTSSWYPWIRPGSWAATALYCENEDTGVLFDITPIDNLSIVVGLPFGANSNVKNPLYSDSDNGNKDLSYHMFEALAADVSYTIPDLLGIRLGWRGGRNTHGDGHGNGGFAEAGYKDAEDNFINVGEVDVYANLLAVENLQLEVGARINILNADKFADAQNDTELDWANDMDGSVRKFASFNTASALIGLKAGYNITDRFSVKADFGVLTYKKYDLNGLSIKHKPDFQFGVGVGVGLTDSLSLDADFRGVIKGDYEGDGQTVDGGDPTFSFMVGLTYACSTNASVGIGFQGKTNGGDIGYLDKRSDNFGFAVPILVNVSF